MPPLVSIITPAFNCENTIKETYESIKNQSFYSWEWIIVEDHSNDNSFTIIKDIVKNDRRVIFFQTSKNSGAAIARNLGISNAKGRYVAFLDADDLWEKEKLTSQITFMEKNNYSFTFTNYDLLYSNGKIRKHRIKKDVVTYKQLLKTNYIGCLTVVYDASILGKIFMPLDCEKREDHGAWLDITRKGVNAYRLDEYLSIYRIGNESVSSNKAKMMKYQYRLYRKHEKFCAIKSLWFTFLCSVNKVFKKY
jgi:glycosyltransferase involved in cell wall biosynthesis